MSQNEKFVDLSTVLNETSASDGGAVSKPMLPTFANYEVLKRLGSGGSGTVYLAQHRLMNRLVAIKTLNAESISDPAALARFMQEARTTSSLKHPRVAAAREVGQDESGVPYIVLDFVEGQSLQEVIESSGPLPPDVCVAITSQICEGLSYAHEKGILHRDIKPSNIFLRNWDNAQTVEATLIDFGIAQTSSAPKLTSTGAVVGTLAYMSPEQGFGLPLGPTADVYSLGCSIFEMLSGRLPFEGAAVLAVLDKHVNAAVPRLDSAELRRFNPIIQRCMAKDPQDRYQCARELAVDIERVRDGLEAVGTKALDSSAFKLLFKRGVAWVIDTLILAVVVGLPLMFLCGGNFVAALGLAAIDQIAPLGSVFLCSAPTVAAVFTVSNLFYHILTESSKHKATFGKRLMRLRLSTIGLSKLSVARVFVRYVLKSLLSAAIFFLLLLTVVLLPGAPEKDPARLPILGIYVYSMTLILLGAQFVWFRKRGRSLYDLVCKTCVESSERC